MAAKPTDKPNRSTVAPFFLLMVSLFFWAAALTRHPADWPNTQFFPNNPYAHNACGAVGAWLAHYAAYWIGDGVYPVLLFTTLLSLTWLIKGRVDSPVQRCFGSALIAAATSTAVAMISGPQADALAHGAGGVLGSGLAELARSSFSTLGAVMILVYVFFVGVAFAAAGWTIPIPDWRRLRNLGDVVDSLAEKLPRIPNARPVPVVTGGGATEDSAEPSASPSRNSRPERKTEDDHRAPQAPGKHVKDAEPDATSESRAPAKAMERLEAKPEAGSDAKRPSPATPPGPSALFPEERNAKSKLPAFPKVRLHEMDPRAVEEGAYPKRRKDWEFPSITLLEDPRRVVPDDYETVVRNKAKILERTLDDFRINAQVVQIDTGPVITMYELQLAAGIKVSQIVNLSNDIARALKAHSVRVVAPIPGKSTVGIEIPNSQKAVVRIKELLVNPGKKLRSMALPLLLGQDASGNPLVTDLTSMPHLLIAGTTGSGKSVCINSIVASFIMTQRPDELKLIMVDPKMVELTQFKDLPHLMSPIVTDVRRAETILEWAVTKMEERYALLAEARVRTLRDYNELGEAELMNRLNPASDAEKNQIPKHLPYIVIIIDELADLMMTSAKSVEHHLCRLAQKSRAVGIHIIVATQRPEAKVVTGLIKSNLPCRIAFRVASRLDSRIVLDQNGAEMLMGQGDMLFLPPGSAKLIRAQGTFVSDSEMHAIIEDLKLKAQPEFHHELVRLTNGEGAEPGERDPMFDEAVRVVLDTGRGSVSLIQRRLNIGFSRASRLIDQMADAGIVGTYKGSQAREVQMTLEEFEAIRRQAASEENSADEPETSPVPPSDSDDPF